MLFRHAVHEYAVFSSNTSPAFFLSLLYPLCFCCQCLVLFPLSLANWRTVCSFTVGIMLHCWEKPHYASFTLWDIDREFQDSHEAYEQYLSRNRRKRTTWECFGGRNQDDELAKALSLGRHVRELMKSGQGAFGTRFEKGDCMSAPLMTETWERDLSKLTEDSNMLRHSLRPTPPRPARNQRPAS